MIIKDLTSILASKFAFNLNYCSVVKILFWNINKKPLADLLKLILDEHQPDLIILAECSIPIIQLLQTINTQAKRIYTLPPNNSPRLIFLSGLPTGFIQPILDEGGIAIRHLFPPLGGDILLIALHLSSKLYLNSDDQAELATRLRVLIEEAEVKVGHQKTLVIGDLNMDPFERGLLSSETLHAVMDRSVAERGSRVVQGKKRHFFYNPMWGRLGDITKGPAGTFYHESPSITAYYWHTFDQVLIRPALLPRFKNEELHILTSAGTTSLLNRRGLPDKKSASDHLPLLLTL